MQIILYSTIPNENSVNATGCGDAFLFVQYYRFTSLHGYVLAVELAQVVRPPWLHGSLEREHCASGRGYLVLIRKVSDTSFVGAEPTFRSRGLSMLPLSAFSLASIRLLSLTNADAADP